MLGSDFVGCLEMFVIDLCQSEGPSALLADEKMQNWASCRCVRVFFMTMHALRLLPIDNFRELLRRNNHWMPYLGIVT